MEAGKLEGILEALLFAAGDVLSLDRLSTIVGVEKSSLKQIMNNMIDSFAVSNRGVLIREINNGYQMYSRPEHFEYLKMLVEPRQKQGLSQAAFETLSIVAYKQPVTKAKIEQIRGVSSESAMAKLLERNLIREAGRMEAPGKPILYETTEEFLRAFGFASINELPPLSVNGIQLADALDDAG